MTQARSRQISLSETPYYHCVNRCVRRAFLCGEDAVTGRSYDHRKQWIVDRIASLSAIFAIDVCAYAVMSNHYHVVLRVKPDAADNWTAEEAVTRWKALFRGLPLVDRYLAGKSTSDADKAQAEALIAQWRERLFDLSWYMRCLNEGIAREANREDGCKGRFWEGRFRSQALLDERAVLACMAYVDLNPIRAGLCDTPEASDFTSVQQRMFAVAGAADAATANAEGQEDRSGLSEPVADPVSELSRADSNGGHDAIEPLPPATLPPLAEFVGSSAELSEAGLPFELADYLLLVDWTGRALRADKHGAIPAGAAPVLQRLGVEAETWIETVRHFRGKFHHYVGPVDALQRHGEAMGCRWVRGIGACRRLWGSGASSDIAAAA